MGLFRTLLLLATTATAAVSQTTSVTPAWTLTLDDPGDIVLSAWSSAANCVAVATNRTVHVFDSSGRPLWAWNYHETNRLIRPAKFHPGLAVSPTCDTVALAGETEYKFVWTAHRGGRHAFLKTIGTPWVVKFDLRGDSIAVSTAASFGYLLSPDLDVRWSGKLADLPVRWPSQAAVASSSRFAEFLREDAEALFDVPPWGQGASDSVSDDGQWRAVWSEPYRGPGTAQLMLMGPGSDGYRGRSASIERGQVRWTKAMGCPDAEVTLDGAFVVATGDPNHPEYGPTGTPPCDGTPLPTYVFDRSGKTVLIWPPDGNRDELSEAVFARTGSQLKLRTHSSWDVPLTPEEVRTLPDTRRRLAYSPDQKMLLVTRERELRLYRAPE
jgi:hypothetical protein